MSEEVADVVKILELSRDDIVELGNTFEEASAVGTLLHSFLNCLDFIMLNVQSVCAPSAFVHATCFPPTHPLPLDCIEVEFASAVAKTRE